MTAQIIQFPDPEERLSERAHRLLSAIPEAQVIAAFEQLERCLARRACADDPTRSP